MDAATLACAPFDMTWNGISWIDVQRHVRRLQARIVKATQVGRGQLRPATLLSQVAQAMSCPSLPTILEPFGI